MTVSHITIFSKDRFRGSTTNFRVKLPSPAKDVVTLSVDRVSLFATWSTVDSANNTFVITVAATPYVVVIPSGVYSSFSTLATAVATALNLAYTPDNLFSCTFDSLTFRFTITHSSTAFVITWSDSQSTAFTLLGWINGTDTASGLSQLAPNYGILQRTGAVHIVADNLSTGQNAFGSSGYAATLLSLNVTENHGESISYQNGGENYLMSFNQKTSLESFDIRLLGDDGEILDNNGVEWSMTFRIQQFFCE